MSAVLRFFVVATLTCAAANSFALPKEVEKFIENRESCDHWRGEEGYDAERQADIDWAICQSCVGTDAELARLKRKYAGNREISEKLARFESQIESKNKAATKQFCKTTRKPSWQK